MLVRGERFDLLYPPKDLGARLLFRALASVGTKQFVRGNVQCMSETDDRLRMWSYPTTPNRGGRPRGFRSLRNRVEKSQNNTTEE